MCPEHIHPQMALCDTTKHARIRIQNRNQIRVAIYLRAVRVIQLQHIPRRYLRLTVRPVIPTISPVARRQMHRKHSGGLKQPNPRYIRINTVQNKAKVRLI